MLQGHIDLPTPFPTERNQDYLGKWPSPGVEREMYRMSLECLLAARSKEDLKTTCVGSKGARRGSHCPKMRQLDHRSRESCNGLEPTRNICIYEFMMTPLKTHQSASEEASKSMHYFANYERREKNQASTLLFHSNRGEVSFYGDTPAN